MQLVIIKMVAVQIMIVHQDGKILIAIQSAMMENLVCIARMTVTVKIRCLAKKIMADAPRTCVPKGGKAATVVQSAMTESLVRTVKENVTA